MTDSVPRRGEIWFTDFSQPIGHEAGFARPALVISTDRFNAHGLATVVPITTTDKSYPTRVRIEPGRSGLEKVSFIQAEQVRTVSTDRLVKLYGALEPAQLQHVERILKLMFDLR